MINKRLQVKILGNVFYLDWLDPTKVSVVWSVSGYGKYGLPVEGGHKNDVPPVNTAVDVYLNQWVQVYLRLEATRHSTTEYQRTGTYFFI